MNMKYRKKPVVIKAFQYKGDLVDSEGRYCVPDWAVKAFEVGIMYYETSLSDELFIETLEGVHHVNVGDYIILGVQGELYLCNPDTFEQTYEEEENER